ncbi:MAG: tetratricopeptide repeat protein [Alphaproteobacteria bacterium]|nr:tetratricopeptide repeat protein [Alphaproteobacteria bacterium]
MKISTVKSLALFILLFSLTACAGTAPSKRATDGEGPISAYARNALATNNPEGLVKIGEGFERSGNLESAYNLYGQAMAAAPDLLAPRLGIARVLGKMGRTDAALNMLDLLAIEYPGNVELGKARIEFLVREARYSEADDIAKGIIAAGVEDGFLWDVAGRLAQVEGDVKRARAMFDHALAQPESQSEALRHMALSFAIEGAYDSAVALLQRAMNNPVTALDAKRSLAMVYALSGQVKAARVIALSAMNQQEVSTLAPLYRVLAELDSRTQATALMFDHIPSEAFKAPHLQ